MLNGHNDENTIMHFPIWTDTWMMRSAAVWLEMTGWTLYHAVITGGRPEPLLNIEAKGAQAGREWLCTSGGFAGLLCLSLYATSSINHNVFALGNSGCLHPRSSTGHLSVYSHGHHNERTKQKNIRLEEDEIKELQGEEGWIIDKAL